MKKIRLSLFLLLTSFYISQACTTAVVSGRYTKDGRPLLLKNRDTWAVKNIIRYFKARPYSFNALVNSRDLKGKSIWEGLNSEGFAIMNSASYNLNVGDITKQTGFEGRVMKQALQYCKTVDDFQHMLDTLQKPYRLEANFGVIDAQGGAAYFELGNQKYTKIDANDSKVAPYGYLIRTNYSFTGKMGIGGGYIRYQTASDLFYNAVSTDQLDTKYIVQKVVRSLKHSLTQQNLAEYGNLPAGQAKYFHFRDFIPRTGSASAVIVQGVKKGEKPEFATMWTVLGFPLTSVVIPTWVKGGNNLPEIVKYDNNLKDSPLCHAALSFKKKCFPIRFGKSERYYININALLNADKTGYMQKLHPIEEEIFAQANRKLAQWRKTKMQQKDIIAFYEWLNSYVKEQYKQNLNYQF